MKLNTFYTFITVALISFNQPVVAQGLDFSPVRVFFKGNPGETVSEVITVSNSTSKPYEFVLSLKDWKRDSIGDKHYFPMGTLANSNARQVALSTTSITLAPGEKRTIPVSFNVPKEERSHSTNSMLFFTQTNAEESTTGSKGMGVKLSMEVGVQLFYSPYAANEGELKFLSLLHEDEKPSGRLAIKYENTGAVNKSGTLRLELTNKNTGEEIKLPPTPIAIMPEDFQWVYSTLPDKLVNGEYLVVAILDAGDNNGLKVAEKNIYVKK